MIGKNKSPKAQSTLLLTTTKSFRSQLQAK